MDAQVLRSYRGMLLAVAVAAVLQVAVIARSPSVTADAIIFASVSQDLAAAPLEALRRNDQHPGFPAMLLASTRLVNAMGDHREPESWMIGGQIVACLCGLASVCILWLFARDLFGIHVADVAALVFAVLPVPRFSASDALSDTPHLVFYLLAAWLASSGLVTGRILRLAGAGLASGVAYWIRPEGLEVALAALACLAWVAFRGQWTCRRAATAAIAVAGATLLVAAPYFVLAGKVTSKQLPFVHAQANVWLAEHESSAPAPNTTPPAPTAPQKHSLALTLRPLAKAGISFLNSACQGFKWVFIPLFLLGHVELVRRNPPWLPLGLIWLLGTMHVAILLSVHMLSGYIAHRHLLPLVALAMPCTALGAIYVGTLAANWLGTRPVWPTLAVVGLSCAIVVPYTLRPFSREFVSVIDATRWVQANAPPGSGVVSNSPYVGIYGNLPVAYLGHDTPSIDAAVAAAGKAHYDYVVLHVGAHGYKPEWLAQIERCFRTVQVYPEFIDGKRAMRVMIFEAKDSQANRGTSRG